MIRPDFDSVKCLQFDLLVSFQGRSRERQSHLESLHDFVSEATQELIWLNEKEEEEVAFDWSDHNGGISEKREYHAVCLETNSTV